MTMEMTMEMKLETVTPDLAHSLLAQNTNNRRMNESSVAYYQNQIERDMWQENGEAIKVSKTGKLLDGQHRLQAVIQAGKPVKMFIVRGLDDDVAITLDTGRSRGPADHLRIYGFKESTNILAAAAGICMGFNNSGEYKPRHTRVAPWEIIGWVENNKKLMYSLDRVPSSAGKLCSRSICTAMHYIFSCYFSPNKANEFFDAFASGENLKKGNPILALRSRMIELRNMRVGSSSSKNRMMMIYYFVQAFKAYNEDRTLSNMLYKDGAEVALGTTI